MFLMDHEYVPHLVEVHTVTLHMQFHARARPVLAKQLQWDAQADPWDLEQCFKAWAALVKLRRQVAAATPPMPQWILLPVPLWL